jgi:hypothetical protein
MPLSRKRLAVTFQLGQGQNGADGFDTIKLAGQLRASAMVTVAGGPAMGRLDLVVYGMTRSNMNKFSTLGMRAVQLRVNNVILEAGDEDLGLAVVYQGTIREAWADLSSMPEAPFRVTGWTGGLEALKPIPPTTYRGLTDVVTIMSGLATQANLRFTNNGVSTSLIDPYFPGTVWDQIKACAEHANINWIHDNDTLAIWPKGAAREEFIPVVSSTTGLVGYPTFTQNGIQCRILYTPSIRYGQKIRVESSIKEANGVWSVNTLTHTLESEIPGGQWFTTFAATPPGITVISR